MYALQATSNLKRELEIWFSYGVILLSLTLSEAVLAPTQSFSADSTWHFKWASDILAANPIFWSGVDANRIFPDLLFSLIAAALPGGQSYDAWVIYYFCISGISLGLSLILLSLPLYSESSERILFFAVSCATFVAVTTTLSFWSFNIMAPGYHGGSLSMVTAGTALFLMNVKAERVNYLFLFAFALICTFLVMSNRYLVVCLVVPLLIAALSATQDRRRHMVLVSATLLSTAAGLEVLHLLNSSNFFRLVATENQHQLASRHDFLSLVWWEGRIPKELRELAGAWRRNQIILGLAIMSAATIWGFWLPFRKSNKNSTLALRRIFRLIVAISTICAVLFVAVMVDDSNDWRYRYFTIPFCLAVIALSAIGVYPFSLKRRAWFMGVFVSILSLMMASVWLSHDISSRILSLLADHDVMIIHNWFANYWMANEKVSVRPFCLTVIALAAIVVYPFGFKSRAWLVAVYLSALSLMMASIRFSIDVSSRRYEAQFRTDLMQLSRLLADHDGMTIHYGFANYWIANEVSVRSSDIEVRTGLTLVEDQPNYWLYNNNASELCSKRDFSFFLLQEERGQPYVDAIVSQIGPPSSRQRIQLGRFGPVQILFYDPELLDKVIVQPGRAAAGSEFPNFQCPNSSGP